MMRYLVTLSYDGSRYQGWQKQPDMLTVQGEVERVFSQILNKTIATHASGRTDAGVHATGQVLHFDSPKKIIKTKFRHSANSLLPSDIHLISIEQIDEDFHARYSVMKKNYRYIVNVGESDPFLVRYAYTIRGKVDVKKMLLAGQSFLGKHNYQNFTTKPEDQDGYIREIFDFSIRKTGSKIVFDVVGDGFMTYMVRMMVASLLAIGLGKEDVSYIASNLDKEERNVISYKAPPEGLYLRKVFYE